MNSALKIFIDGLKIDAITAERKRLLQDVQEYILQKTSLDEKLHLNFICTHNSRRSQFGQVWAQTIGRYYNFDIQTYSGGVEVTAFNETAVNTLKNQGFELEKGTGSNPVYRLFFSAEEPPILAFSKLFDDDSSPSKGFAALMTCSHADENCPFIPGAEKRLPLTYEDPKISDGTQQEQAVYKERSREIATEMKFVFSTLRR